MAYGDPLERLSEFPILAGTDSGQWVAYTLAGIARYFVRKVKARKLEGE